MHIQNKRNAVSEAFGIMLGSVIIISIMGYAFVISSTDIEKTFEQTHNFLDIAAQTNSEILTIQNIQTSPLEIEIINIGQESVMIKKVLTSNNNNATFTIQTLDGTFVTEIQPSIVHVLSIQDNSSPEGAVIITEKNNPILLDFR